MPVYDMPELMGEQGLVHGRCGLGILGDPGLVRHPESDLMQLRDPVTSRFILVVLGQCLGINTEAGSFVGKTVMENNRSPVLNLRSRR
jgi:hypothetical protein